MPDNQYHYAFDAEYSGILRELVTVADIFPYPTFHDTKGIRTNILWDTGATYSSLSPKIVQSLGLRAIDTIVVHGVNNATKIADVVIASITLSDSISLAGKRFSVIEIPGADVLIGMDIIMLGDFAISNGEGKTQFSFVIPPFKNKIAFTEKANAINDRLSKRENQ